MELQVASSLAEPVALAGDELIYLVRNDALERLLFDRDMVGVEFRRTCLHASCLFIRHIVDEIESTRVAELLILSKGIVYQLSEAFAIESGKNLPTNLVATTRVGVEADTAKIDVPYARLDAGGDVLIIGDTVASGSTIVAALDEYRKEHALLSIYIFSYAGSIVGGRRILSYCGEHGINSTILYGLAAFGLGINGFDLSFLHPDTITRAEYVERARTLFRDQAFSAVGWDFGSQAMAPQKYRELSWVESKVSALDEGILRAVSQPLSFDHLWREKDAFSSSLDKLELGRTSEASGSDYEQDHE